MKPLPAHGIFLTLQSAWSFLENIMLNALREVVRRITGSSEVKAALEPWIAATEIWPPYNYPDAVGNPTGYSTEVVRLILRKAHIAAEIQMIPWTNAYVMAKTRPNTLLFTVLRKPERDGLFTWVGPIAPSSLFFFKLATRTDVEVNSIRDATRYQLGIAREGGFEMVAKTLGFEVGLNLDVCSDDEAVVWKLTNRRIDLIIDTELSAAYRASTVGSENTLAKLSQLDQGVGHYLAISKGSDPEVVSALQSAFIDVKRSGAIDAVYQQYRSGAASLY